MTKNHPCVIEKMMTMMSQNQPKLNWMIPFKWCFTIYSLVFNASFGESMPHMLLVKSFPCVANAPFLVRALPTRKQWSWCITHSPYFQWEWQQRTFNSITKKYELLYRQIKHYAAAHTIILVLVQHNRTEFVVVFLCFVFIEFPPRFTTCLRSFWVDIVLKTKELSENRSEKLMENRASTHMCHWRCTLLTFMNDTHTHMRNFIDNSIEIPSLRFCLFFFWATFFRLFCWIGLGFDFCNGFFYGEWIRNRRKNGHKSQFSARDLLNYKII